MSDRLMLKVGGSVITDKSGDCTINHQQLESIAVSIARAIDGELLVVHGAGSCGHPEAKQYRINEGVTRGYAEGISITHYAVSKLNIAVVTALRDQGIDAIGIHPLHVAYANDRKLVSFEYRQLDQMLKLGMVPVIHGDVVMDHKRGSCIISGDQIVRYLAPLLGMHRVGLATDVPGVLDGGAVVPVITPASVRSLQIGSSSHTDVTGGMKGKINELLDLAKAGIESEIFHVSHISDFLFGRDCSGTKVSMKG